MVSLKPDNTVGSVYDFDLTKSYSWTLASFGTINHLYILGLLEKAGLTPADVTLVNTPPPEMTVALLAKGVDASLEALDYIGGSAEGYTTMRD